MLKNLFQKKPPSPGSFAPLHTDLHSHLIPGVDDGVHTVEESIGLIRQLVEMGYKKIYTTPHIMTDHWPNTPETIFEGWRQVKEGLKEIGGELAGIEFSVAAEYFIDEFFSERIKTEKLLTLPGNRVLVEMAGVAPASNLHDIIFQLRTKGYNPIMAHPERYPYYQRDFNAITRLKEYGCKLQVNLLSFSGHYGPQACDLAYTLIKKNMVDYLGTDLHRQQHADLLKELLLDKKVKKVLEGKWFGNVEL